MSSLRMIRLAAAILALSAVAALPVPAVCRATATTEDGRGAGRPAAAANLSPAEKLMAPPPPRLWSGIPRLQADGSPSLQRERLAGVPAPASLHAVVLLCDFADSLLLGRWGTVPGDFPPPRQSDYYYAAHDSLFFVHQFQDVADYFAAVSGGRFELNVDVVGRVANLPRAMGWYGDDPDKGEQSVLLAADVVAACDPYVDFSRYDTVVLVHAGAGEETDILGDSPEQVYSTYLGPEDFAAAAADTVIPDPFLPTEDVDGQGQPVTVRHVLVLPETEYQDPYGGAGGRFGSLGVYCFEVGLRLGMLSLSDFTPSGHPDSQGVGEFDLMGYGLFVASGYMPCHPSAFNKLLMGWVEPYAVSPGAGRTYTLDPIEAPAGEARAARVEIGPREYWLLEYRLQDPDGNRIFSFPGDLNGDNVPDFYDANSALGNGVPTGLFDPATDVKERLTGAEFDFFMSERQGEVDGVATIVKGTGSGLYVWHVDEGVIADVIDAPNNLFNADPSHKSVDLEEADGIQDLDSRQSSYFMLGSELDAFRGEGNSAFGPATNPDTRSAAGAWTGVWIDRISAVVDTSAAVPGDPTIHYFPTMSFRCWREDAAAGGARPAGDVLLDGPAGVDLRGSHLLAVDLDGAPDGAVEIVAAGARGEVLAFRADLTEYRDGDADTGSVGILALATDAAGQPARWCGPAAAGDIDGDGRAEIVLTTGEGLYAFNGEDGSETADGDGDPRSRGRLVALQGCALPPVLLPPPGVPQAYSAGQSVAVCLVESAGDASRLRFVTGAGEDFRPAVDLGAVAVAAPPLLVADKLLVAAADTSADTGLLVAVSWPASGTPAVVASVELGELPGGLGLAGAVDDTSDGAIAGWAVAVGESGGVDLVSWRGGAFDPAVHWDAGAAVATPLGLDLAHGLADGFALCGREGFPHTGWPVVPSPGVDFPAAGLAPSPLACALDAMGGGDGARAHLFQARDGRLFLCDARGRLQRGWPLAGPSETAGTPLLTDLDRDGTVEMVAAGTFPRLVGRDEESGDLLTRPVSRLAAWEVGAGGDVGGWPMWRANAWRTPDPAWPTWGGAVTPGPGLLRAGAPVCYPSPLVSGPLHVRAEALAACSVQAFLYDLAGEEVAASAPVAARAGEPVEIQFPMSGKAAGLYLCRLVASGAAGGQEVRIRPVAVVK